MRGAHLVIKRIAHVCIATTDLAAVERLYCQGFGFTRRFDFTRNGNVVGFYLHAGEETFLEVFHADEVPWHGSPIRHLCLETDDIDAAMARVVAAGFEVGEKKLGADNTWQFWVKNSPNGVAIEVQQYTRDSCQQTGKPCEVNWM
jgi:catechol 2,3-dioxygenase-like lactoylglutathione lyase family enzyme